MTLTAIPQRIMYAIDMTDEQSEYLDYFERYFGGEQEITLYKVLDDIGPIWEIEYGYGTGIYFAIDVGDEHLLDQILQKVESFLNYTTQWCQIGELLEQRLEN